MSATAVRAQPIAPNNAHVNAALTDFATKYENSQFIADELSKPLLVSKLSDEYYKRLREDQAELIIDDYVGPRSEIPEVTYSTERAVYLCRTRAQKAAVPALLEANADAALSPREFATQKVMQNIKLARENRVATLIMTQGNWAASNTSAVTHPWTDIVDGHPIRDMKLALQAIPFNGDDVSVIGVCSDIVFDTLQLHPEVKDLRGGGDTKGGLVPADEIARAVGFERLLVSKIHKNTAAKGLTPTYSRIWGTSTFAFVVVPKGLPSVEAMTFCVTFRFTGLPGSQQGFRVREWHVPSEGQGTDYVAVDLADDDQAVVQNDAGYLLRSVA